MHRSVRYNYSKPFTIPDAITISLLREVFVVHYTEDLGSLITSREYCYFNGF